MLLNYYVNKLKAQSRVMSVLNVYVGRWETDNVQALNFLL